MSSIAHSQQGPGRERRVCVRNIWGGSTLTRVFLPLMAFEGSPVSIFVLFLLNIFPIKLISKVLAMKCIWLRAQRDDIKRNWLKASPWTAADGAAEVSGSRCSKLWHSGLPIIRNTGLFSSPQAQPPGFEQIRASVIFSLGGRRCNWKLPSDLFLWTFFPLLPFSLLWVLSPQPHLSPEIYLFHVKFWPKHRKYKLFFSYALQLSRVRLQHSKGTSLWTETRGDTNTYAEHSNTHEVFDCKLSLLTGAILPTSRLREFLFNS